MTKSCLVVFLLLALFVGIVCVGCVQSSGSNAPSQSGGNVASASQTSGPSNSQNYNPTQSTQTINPFYSVGMSINESTASSPGGVSKPATVVWYNGGPGAANVQFITVTVNDQKIGQMGPFTGLPVPVGTSMTLPIKSLDNTNHVVATGHFSDGKTQVILDTMI
ncbi:MAG: hypothetical protein WCC86_07535 [Methanoregula sp.]